MPLDEVGIQQAQKLAGRFAAQRGLTIYSSDLERARVTAESIASVTDSSVIVDPRLRERGFGEFEGMEFNQFRNLAWERPDAFEFRPANGESFYDVWNRIEEFLSLTSFDNDAIIVSHGGTAGVLLSQLLRGTIETARSFRFANTCVCELERRPDGWYNLIDYNSVTHLAEPARQGDSSGSAP